jgi:DNA-directed RNA polymerase specialized sigma24 family protein
MATMERSGGLCLLLKDLAGLRYAEIAEVLGLDTAQVRVHVASARAALLPAM